MTYPIDCLSHAVPACPTIGEGEFEPPTRNLSGTLPDASDDSLPSKVKEPFVFYGVPTRAGDRGRTGNVQLGKLASGRESAYDFAWMV